MKAMGVIAHMAQIIHRHCSDGQSKMTSKVRLSFLGNMHKSIFIMLHEVSAEQFEVTSKARTKHVFEYTGHDCRMAASHARCCNTNDKLMLHCWTVTVIATALITRIRISMSGNSRH